MITKIIREKEDLFLEFEWFNRRGELESQKIELNTLKGTDGEINEAGVKVCVQAKYGCYQDANEEKWIYHPSEVHVLVKHLHGTAMFLPVYLACVLGLSKAEALGLTWQDVNFDRNTIMAKNGMVVRIVHLRPEIRDTLAYYLKLQTEHYQVDHDGAEPSWQVCLNEDGTPVDEEELCAALQDAAEKEGLVPLAFDELRFSAAMMMATYKDRVPDICGWLGYQNSLFDTIPVSYCHWSEEN